MDYSINIVSQCIVILQLPSLEAGGAMLSVSRAPKHTAYSVTFFSLQLMASHLRAEVSFARVMDPFNITAM